PKVRSCSSFISITMLRILIDPGYLLRLKPRWIHAPRSDSNPIGQCSALRDIPATTTLSPVMKRLALVFLMLLLPLQSVWAVASTYCQHEQDSTAQHFGHHTHQHNASTDRNDGSGKSPLNVHADCGICHLTCPAAIESVRSLVVMASGSLVVAHHPYALPSVFPDHPERPKWVLAA
ncbi:MAG: hypothetical protein U1A72_24050, partial [Sulfuritalea sp.]|nr:hypothetical protein [Sulfuritalea sp.]